MERKSTNEERLIRYLLGEWPEEEMRELEENYFLNDKSFDELQAAERELIDRYVEGNLSKEDQHRFEDFFLSAPARQEKLRFARALKKYIPDRSVTQSSPTYDHRRSIFFWIRSSLASPIGVAVAGILAIAIGFGVWKIFFYQSAHSQVLATLSSAYREQRYVEARISGVDHSPFSQLRGDEQTGINKKARDQAALMALKEVNDNPTPESHHALGQVYLAEQRFDDAIAEFKKALEMGLENAQIHSDMGAALLEKSQLNKEAVAIAESRIHINKSLELNPGLLEALFNRALWHEYYTSPDQAKSEWQNYLDKDSSSKWANEVRERLTAIEEKKGGFLQTPDQLFQDFLAAYLDKNRQKAWQALSKGRSRTGNTITQRLIDEYLQSSENGQSSEAHIRLQMLSYAGFLEYEVSRDRFPSDLSQFYSRITPAQQKLTRQARELMKSAYENSKHTEYEKAIEHCSQAKDLFHQAGNLCEQAFAEYWIGSSNLRINPDESMPILKKLCGEFEDKEYKGLLLLAFYAMSDAQSSKRNFSESLEYSNRGFTISCDVNDPSSMLRGMQSPVTVSQQVGDYAESIGHILRAFDLASTFSPEPHEVWPFYFQMASNFNSMKFPTVALSFQQTAMSLALKMNSPIYISRSYALLGLIYQTATDYDRAIYNAQLALEESRKIKGEKSRDNLIASSLLNLAHIYRETGNFSQALEYYGRAIELHAKLNLDIYKFQAQRGKILSLISLPDDAMTSAEIEKTVAMLEQYRPKIQEESYRNNFFDLAQSVYDISIGFTYSRLNADKRAFQYAETSHARSLLDLVAASTKVINGSETPDNKFLSVTHPLTLSKIIKDLPPQVQLLQYAVLNDRVLIWFISKKDFRSEVQFITSDQLDEKIGKFLSLVSEGPQSDITEVKQCARGLYQILISPVASLLDKQKQLYIIPDKALHQLPFQVLVSGESDNYLIEDYALAFSPSSSLFINCSETAAIKAGEVDENILSIGDPSFAPSDFPGLGYLPSAADEARKVADLYNLGIPLLRDKATASEMKSRMGSADVIHFAGHYFRDPRSPMLSKFVLAKNPLKPDELLRASDIYHMNLPRTRLAVLSACQTGIERSYNGEGVLSIARPFIKAGVPVVIATLWPIETKSSAELMINFHRHRKEGLSTIEALQLAQKKMIHKEGSNYIHPYYWASFTLIGGYATF